VSSTDVPHGKPAPDVFLRARPCWRSADALRRGGGLHRGDRRRAGRRDAGGRHRQYRSPDQLARATKVVRNYEEIEKLLLPKN